MKIAHLADTHLGFSAYRRLSENGYNQREEDVINSFTEAIDKIISLKPAVVLHSGDLFDTVRPTNRIVKVGIEQLLRLYQAKIPLVLISGNHETPKQLYKGSIYSIFEALPLNKEIFRIVYKERYESFEFDGLTIHAIPQCTTDEIFRQELKKIKLDPETKNVLMLHAGVTGMKEFSHGESNELLVDYEWLNKANFDYVALGHYHICTKVGKNAWFAGSTERMSFNEAGQTKGFLEVDLTGEAKTNIHAVKSREMIDIPPITADGKDSVILLEEILKAIEKQNPRGKILRLAIKNIPQHVMSTLDTKKIREATKDAVHFEAKYEKINEEGKTEEVKILSGGVKEEFKSFLAAEKNLTGSEQERFFRFWAQEYDKIIKEEEE